MFTRQDSRLASGWTVKVLALIIAIVAAISSFVAVPPSRALATPPQSPTRTQVVVALTRLGFEPESLAAAGLTANGISPLIESVRSALAQDPGLLLRADASVAAMRRLLDTARKRSESDPTRDTQISESESRLAQAIAARDLVLSTLRDAALAHAAPEVATRHALIVRNRAWNLPIRYLVKNHSEGEWVALRDALARANGRSTQEDDLAPALRAIIDAEDRDVEVLAAAQRLRPEVFDGFSTAWTAAIQALPVTP